MKPSYAHLFSDSYLQAREKFLSAARDAPRLETFEHPEATGINDEPLFMDCCRLGPEDADVVVLTLSGTHGGEGYCGSALQAHLLTDFPENNLPPGVAVVHIHAVNPFGFSHFLRTNENDVDLNRNWIDFDAPPPINPLYDEIVAQLPASSAPDNDVISEWLETFRQLEERYGRWEVDNALSAGQYHRPGSIGFGGSEPQWSRRTLEKALPDLIGSARHVAYLDWHSLLRLGDGKLIFLCFNEVEDHLYQRAGSWWGSEAIDRNTVNKQWSVGTSAANRRSSRRGLAMWGVQNLLAPRTDLAGAVIEFCTEPDAKRDPEFIEVEQYVCERYLQNTGDFTSETAKAAIAVLRESTCPSSKRFREGMIAAGTDAFASALEGAGQWAAENCDPKPGQLLLSSEF